MTEKLSNDRLGGNDDAPAAPELSKEEINRLPLRRYAGDIHLIRSDPEAKRALERLVRERLLGFDTETRPAFRKGAHFPPSLVQLAGESAVYIFQIGVLGFLDELREILSDASILKVGVGLDYDLKELVRLRKFKPANFEDLGEVARQAGYRRVSLRTLTATFLGFRISKGAKCSNWSVPELRPSQVRYAATDAWVSREIYLGMASEKIVSPVEGIAGLA